MRKVIAKKNTSTYITTMTVIFGQLSPENPMWETGATDEGFFIVLQQKSHVQNTTNIIEEDSF